METKETYIDVIVLLVIAIGIMLAFNILSYSFENSECQKWQYQSQQYVGFYLTKWQKEQCDVHNIMITSPVR